MTTLREVLGAILRDIDEAQAYSNRVARDIADQWRDDGQLLPLDVPNAWMSGLSLELHFAIADVAQQPPRRREARLSRSTFTAAAGGIATAATHSAAAYVRERLDLADDRQRWESIAGAIEEPEFRIRLRNQLEDALFAARTSIVSGTPPSVDIDAAAAIVDDTLAAKFFGEGPLAPVFVDGSKARQQTLKRIGGVIREHLAAVHSALTANGGAAEIDPEVRVIVASNELAELPPHLVSVLKIPLDMRKYRWLACAPDDLLLIEQK